MSLREESKIEGENLSEFLMVMETGQIHKKERVGQKGAPEGRINLDPEKVKNGLAQLVLTLMKLIHELVERQAIRRIDAGSLSENEIERVGLTLKRQMEELERLRRGFGLEEDDLNIDLGPLGKLL